MYRLDEEFGFELPEEDEPKLLDQCAQTISRGLFTIVTLALCTGMRKGEIMHLRWGQIFLLDEPHLIVGVSKTSTGRRRRVPLNARAIATLTEWARQFPNLSPDHFVFPQERYSRQPKGRPTKIHTHDPTRPLGTCRTAWKAAGRRTGIEMRFHDLRHTAVSRMLRAGVPLTTVAQIVGWSASTMYLMAKRYAHILQPEMRKAVAVLEGKARADLPTAADNPPQPVTISGQRTSHYVREELYEKVWKAPIQTVAKEYGVSDVALGKTCKKLHVPLPGRGYWAKKAAQRPVPPQPSLPTVPVIENTNGMRVEIAAPDSATTEATPADSKKKPVQSEKPTTLEKRKLK